MVRFEDKVADILYSQGRNVNEVCSSYGIDTAAFYATRRLGHCPQRKSILAWAYMLKMDVEELVEGTDVESYWHGGARKRG